MRDLGGESPPEEVPVGSRRSASAPRAPALSEPFEGSPRGGLLFSFGERLDEGAFDVILGKMEGPELLVDTCRPPVLALGARAGDVAGESRIIQVASLREKGERDLDLLRGVARAGHFCRELTLAVASAREALESEGKRLDFS